MDEFLEKEVSLMGCFHHRKITTEKHPHTLEIEGLEGVSSVEVRDELTRNVQQLSSQPALKKTYELVAVSFSDCASTHQPPKKCRTMR